MIKDLKITEKLYILVYHFPPSNTFTSIDKNYRDFGDDILTSLLKENFTPKYIV